MHHERLLRSAFLYSATIILALTSAVKILSVLGETRILGRADPLFWILTNRQVLALTAGLELAVAATLVSQRLDWFGKTLTVAWLATLFLAYRLGLWVIGYKQACSCLGDNAAAWLHVSPKALDLAMSVVLGFLLLGSYALLIAEVMLRRSVNVQKNTQGQPT